MNREQMRARNAFSAVRGREIGNPREFLPLAQKLPAMFQTNGLLASWAFLLAKSEARHRAALAACQRHLASMELLRGPDGESASDVFSRWLGQSGRGPLSGVELQALTAETIEFAAWLKRAAEAVLTGAEEGRSPAAGSEERR